MRDGYRKFGTVSRLILGGALAAGLNAGGAAAQTQTQQAQAEMDAVLVTATRTPTRIEDVGSSVSVIDRREIEAQQYKTVTAALQTVPGLRMVQSGSRGTQTSIFTRGTNTNQTLVLLNGQRISDPSTPGGAFNFANMTTDNVQRIEVVRGPQSALYGSDAIGGVVNIITRTPEDDGIQGQANLQAGTLETLDGSVNVNGRQGRVGFDVTLSGVTTGGDTITPSRFRPAGADGEDDGYNKLQGAARLEVDLSDRLDLSLYGEAQDAEAEIDGFRMEDPNSEGDTRRYVTSAELSGSFWDGKLRPSLSVGYTDYRRDNDNPADTLSPNVINTRNEGNRASVTAETEIDVHADHTLVVGGEFYHETFDSTGQSNSNGSITNQNSDAETDNYGLFLQDIFHLTDRLSGTAGIRFDDAEDFNEQVTWHVAPTYRIPSTGTRLKASLGTGFKTPSLFERFGFITNNRFGPIRGNPNLDAEKSFGWEIGIEQSIAEDRVRLGTTFFQNEIDDVVDFAGSTFVNIDDIETHGLESFIAFDPVETVTLRLDHTWLEAEDRDTGQRLDRRPRHKASIDATWRPDARWTLSGGVLAIKDTKDVDALGGQVDLNNYAVARVAGSYRVNERIDVTARVENLSDNTYETADGFQAPGLEAFVGTRVRF